MLINRNPLPVEMGEVYSLRWNILRNPHLPMDGSERDVYDDVRLHPETIHGAMYDSGLLVSTGRIHQVADDPSTWQVRYMATKEDYRGKGVGSRVLGSMERELKEARLEIPPTVLIANARVEALSLYRRMGYIVIGDEFELVDVPHVKIAKRIHGGIW